ncbi:MAG: metalloregulator ArsR/SmtB family transcription factor [Pirellulaceae bacterium]|nr:winged helix-turn-helix transcriptional regulator [Planctomycetales bacterium]MCA9161348.1 winged helix-turn-helix transcriptional regulator [Planctomycetales bacterium]MCA9202764.1 winged helix-turn-helix transcriptional regulator [Planctomycetales bacterium]MCA9207162.1 winged helix-turn-helix transcriptional regulator [Planctomycetales bacterium]MCA9224998.1 winged helix-turn-helix transcriptional regulator [Planctomycetales bacterium]
MQLAQIKPPSCASLLKVLADETRLTVVQQLLDGPKHVGEINAELNVEQSLLSHHLKVLRDAGLVCARRDGKAVLYELAPGMEASQSGKAINLGCCLLSFE